ncbi:MAG: glycosyltransferase family 2 protein, partial [Porticoccaceae bacterium]
MTPSLSLVIPICNEEDSIAPLATRTHAAMAAYEGNWELIFVDDGSTDASPQRLRQAMETYGTHVQTLRLARNQGQTAALQSGFDAARGELIATLDGDLQNDPTDIPRMVGELLARDLDLLCGRRANRQDDWLTRKLPSRIANRLIARVSGLHLHDYGCTLKVYRAAVIKQVRLYGEMHRLIPLWAAMVTAPERIGETAVAHHP